MEKRAFTLIEVIVTVVIACILATLGLPAYQNVVESSKEKVCDTNLFTLKKAVDMYTVEHDTVPGSLSQLDDKYIRKAYASVMSGKDAWKLKLAYLIAEGPQWGRVYAAALETFGMPHLRCPSNTNTSPTAVSYGLNSGVAGMTAEQYKNLPEDSVIVADSEGELFDYNANGCSGPAPQINPWGYTAISFTSINNVRFHKEYRILSQPISFLKSVYRSGRIGKVTSSNCTADKEIFHLWW